VKNSNYLKDEIDAKNTQFTLTFYPVFCLSTTQLTHDSKTKSAPAGTTLQLVSIRLKNNNYQIHITGKNAYNTKFSFLFLYFRLLINSEKMASANKTKKIQARNNAKYSNNTLLANNKRGKFYEY